MKQLVAQLLIVGMVLPGLLRAEQADPTTANTQLMLYSMMMAEQMKKSGGGSSADAMAQMMMMQAMQAASSQKSNQSRQEKSKEEDDKNKITVPTPTPLPSNEIKTEVEEENFKYVEDMQKQQAEQQANFQKNMEKEPEPLPEFPIPSPTEFVIPGKTSTTSEIQPTDDITAALVAGGKSALPEMSSNSVTNTPASNAGAGAGTGSAGAVAGVVGAGGTRSVASESPAASAQVAAAAGEDEQTGKLKGMSEAPEGSGGDSASSPAASGGGGSDPSAFDQMLAKMSEGMMGPQAMMDGLSPELVPSRSLSEDGKPVSIFEIARMRYQYAAHEEKRLKLNQHKDKQASLFTPAR